MRNSRLLPYDTKELRCKRSEKHRRCALRMARGNYVDHSDNAAFGKFQKKMKKGKQNPEKLCYTGLVCYQYEEEINDGKLF